MVNAILEGRKSVTRRVVKLRHGADVIVTNGKFWKPSRVDYEGYVDCPYGQPGDKLWVRETFADLTQEFGQKWERFNQETRRYETGQNPFVWYRADGEQPTTGGSFEKKPWRPPIHMPRWASRIILDITEVRIERLNDISEEDAIKEGIERVDDFFGCPCWRVYGEPDGEDVSCPDDPIGSFRSLWESINGPGSWDANPFVWVIGFRKS